MRLAVGLAVYRDYGRRRNKMTGEAGSLSFFQVRMTGRHLKISGMSPPAFS